MGTARELIEHPPQSQEDNERYFFYVIPHSKDDIFWDDKERRTAFWRTYGDLIKSALIALQESLRHHNLLDWQRDALLRGVWQMEIGKEIYRRQTTGSDDLSAFFEKRALSKAFDKQVKKDFAAMEEEVVKAVFGKEAPYNRIYSVVLPFSNYATQIIQFQSEFRRLYGFPDLPELLDPSLSSEERDLVQSQAEIAARREMINRKLNRLHSS